MPQLLSQDNIPTPVVASTTSLTLATTNLGQPTSITVGGQSYQPSTTLTLNAATTGANGLDTGSLSGTQLYYLYAIVNNSTFALALIASQTAPGTGPIIPSGYYSAYKLIGVFNTLSGQIISATPSSLPTGTNVYVPGVNPGYLPVTGVPGSTSGSTVSAGYVGEIQTFQVGSGSYVAFPSSGTVANICTASLTAGAWRIDGSVALYANSASITSSIQIGVSTASATLQGFKSQGYGIYAGSQTISGSTREDGYIAPSRIVYLSSSQTIYLVGTLVYSTATPQYQASMLCTRIA